MRYYTYDPKTHSVWEVDNLAEIWTTKDGKDLNKSIFYTEQGCIQVSTVFLGIDHSYYGIRPLLFESMVFGVDKDLQYRYSTYHEAKLGHQKLVELYIYTDFNTNSK